MKDLETQHIPIQFIDTPDMEVNQEIQELAESVKDRGLLHPIAVQSLNKEDGKPHFKVVAGRKRLLACELIGVTDIPCIVIKGTEVEIQLIEIEENLRRYNLPWWEIAKSVADWHRLRQEEKGKALPIKGKANREKPGWSMRDTAAELKMSLGFVSEAVKLDEAVKRDPTLRNIKDRDSAIRAVRAAAKRIEAEQDAGLPVEFEVNQIYNGSAKDILKNFPRDSFHAVITDPPWLNYVDDKLTRDDETVPVFSEVFRVMRPDSILYMFVGFDDFRSYSRRLPQFGFTVSKTPLLWVKKELKIREAVPMPFEGMEDQPAKAVLHGVLFSKGARPWEYSRDFELILLAAKGSPSLTHETTQSSIKVFPPLAPVKLTHPNEKPVELIEDLLDDCSHEDSLILDPFMGSGAHIEAMKRRGRRYIGIERNHDFYEQCKARLAKVK